MKKTMALLFLSILILLPYVTSTASSFQIVELSQQTPDYWNESYDVQGRTIEINVPIEIPEVEKIPILTGSFGFTQLSQDKITRYRKMEHTFDFNPNNDITFVGMGVNKPMTGLTGEEQGKCKQTYLNLKELDWNQAYAENNMLTVSQAWNIFQNEIEYCYGTEIKDNLFIDSIMLYDRFKRYNKKTGEYGEPLREHGSYQFTCFQAFHGVPLLCPVRSTFKQNTSAKENFGLPKGLFGIIATEASFHFRFALMEEKKLIEPDVQVCGFEEMKESYEKLILENRIRNIYTLRLGYVMFLDKKNDELYWFIPCWVAECDYYSSPKAKDEEREDENLYTESVSYRKIIVNALNGELTDPENKNKNRSIVPSF